MGLIKYKLNNLEEAKKLLWQALTIRKRQLDNLKVSETLKNIGDVHKKEDRFDLATECYDECLRIRRHELGNSNEQVADALVAMGKVQQEMERFEEAKQNFKEALLICTKLYGESDDRVSNILFFMGSLEFHNEEYDSALSLFEEYYRIH